MVSVRAVLLGLMGVTFICGLTPYNDYALNNTFLVGNNLPLGVVMFLFLFVLLINAPLARFAPRWAFSAGELTVAFSMTLVSCALPSSGLMRYLPPALVTPFYLARSNHEYLSLLSTMHLPQWLLPVFEGSSPSEWINDPVVIQYLERTPAGDPPPYRAWIRPAVTWGIFTFALYGALLCMMALVRRQWHENERLPFPLAQIYLPLIEPPPPGRMLNELFLRKSFWIAFASVFFLHCWNGLHYYYPEHFERIPVYYNLWNLFTESPWQYVDNKIKDAAVFFTVVGVTYFLSSSVAFSLWFFFVAHQVYRMYLGVTTGDSWVYGQQDQHFGGIIAYSLAVLWVGRQHWKLILAQAFRGRRGDEPEGRYLPYPLAFWGYVGCAVVMMVWLVLAGMTPLAAVVTVMLMLMLFFMIGRIIAEVGLVHGQLQAPIQKPWVLMTIYGWPKPVPIETFYVSSMLQTVHYDFREVVTVYASHGLKVADQTMYAGRAMEADTPQQRRWGRWLIGLMALALVVGYVVSFASTLWTEYHHAWTKDVQAKVPINDWGALNNPQGQLIGATAQYDKGTYHLRHSPAANITFGFAFTSLLSVLRLRYPWWPLHPIGYLMIPTYPGAHLWFSIFWGWLAKLLILRFGGSRLYVNAKPFFLGLIVGESLAAGFWLTMGIVLSAMGIPYRPVNIMPG